MTTTQALLLLALTLNFYSCGLLKNEHYGYQRKAIISSYDQVTEMSYIRSGKMMNTNRDTSSRGLHYEVYIIKKNKNTFSRIALTHVGDKAVYANHLLIKCGGDNLVTVNRTSDEKWSKRFDATCYRSSCKVTEEMDFLISNANAKKILTCNQKLILRVVGSSGFNQKITTPKRNKNFHNGMKDILAQY